MTAVRMMSRIGIGLRQQRLDLLHQRQTVVERPYRCRYSLAFASLDMVDAFERYAHKSASVAELLVLDTQHGILPSSSGDLALDPVMRDADKLVAEIGWFPPACRAVLNVPGREAPHSQ